MAARRRAFSAALVTAAAAALACVVIAAGVSQSRGEPPARSIAAARAALDRHPLDPDALTRLGLAEAAAGQTERADLELSTAARRSWWSGDAHAWLMDRRLAQHRFGEAFEHADSLLRRVTTDAERTRLIDVLARAAVDPAAAAPMIRRLGTQPPWRAYLLQAMGDRAEAETAMRTILAGLAAGSSPPLPAEYAGFVNRITGLGRYADGWAAWRAAARAPEDGRLAPVSDGSDFTWSLPAGPGLTTLVRPDAIVVGYDADKDSALPRRMLVLAAGRWRLSGGAADPARARWELRCLQSDVLLGVQPAAAPLALDVTVPAQGCPAQWLSLVPTPADHPPEVPGVVIAEIRALRIERAR
jgi:hypothetical protein